MSVPAFMLSLLGRQRLLLGARFLERYPSNWLVWEPGTWRPARSESTSNTEATQLPTGGPTVRPVGDDALCFELKRRPTDLQLGRATDNQIVVNDLTVSRTQLHLTFADGTWRVHTQVLVMVDGLPVGAEGAVLKNASVVVIGDVRLTFYEPEGFLVRLQHDPAKGALPLPAAISPLLKRR
ncbi:MAG: FHA domain-containing protein [Archangium sp.]|nr:FHA domain-containing protein [Archangium sp.]